MNRYLLVWNKRRVTVDATDAKAAVKLAPTVFPRFAWRSKVEVVLVRANLPQETTPRA